MKLPRLLSAAGLSALVFASAAQAAMIRLTPSLGGLSGAPAVSAQSAVLQANGAPILTSYSLPTAGPLNSPAPLSASADEPIATPPAALSVLDGIAPRDGGPAAPLSGPAFDGGKAPDENAAVASAAPTPERLERLRSVSLMPSSPEALKAGLQEYIRIAQEAVEEGRWPEIQGEAGAKLDMLIGMLEFLETALSKDVKPCGKCVSKRSCSKVNSGKACPGCVSSVQMDLAQTQAALESTRALAAHVKAPTPEGLKALAEKIGGPAAAN